MRKIDWHFHISYYIFVFALLFGIILILIAVLDAIRERWYFFIPGIVLLGVAFFTWWRNKDKPVEGSYINLDPVGKAIQDWEKDVQQGGTDRPRKSRKRNRSQKEER